jgi:acyl-CoA reductase-like NAD-dependent aldehyde dehydrogenase
MSDRQTLLETAQATGTVPDLPNGHFIDGRFVASADGREMESDDPGAAKPFASFARGGSDDVAAAVENAARAFEQVWRDMPPAERGRILMRASQGLKDNAERLAVVECLDSGKPYSEALGDVNGAVRAFEYYAGACDKLQGDTFPLGPDYLGYSFHEPVGVTAHILPWNFPISTAARGIAPALAAGCAVVAKPAEQTPFTALLLAEILSQAGLPDGICNVVTGTGAEAGQALVAHPLVNHITFTGSVPTGQHVMRAAADNVTRLVLELGGKSPVVVMADCDLDHAVDGVLGAIYENAGQVCSAGSRLVVETSVHDEMVERLCRRTEALTIGHGLTDPQVGPVNSAQQLDKIAGFIDRAQSRGLQMATGGRTTTDPKTGAGWFFQPTIAVGLGSDDELVQQEIFGPVLAVQRADDAEHAIALANATEYALVAGIYTGDFGTAHRMARRIDAGQVYINEYFAGGIEVPFGGNRKSGFGREKGLEGLLSYCRTKSVAGRIA